MLLHVLTNTLNTFIWIKQSGFLYTSHFVLLLILNRIWMRREKKCFTELTLIRCIYVCVINDGHKKYCIINGYNIFSSWHREKILERFSFVAIRALMEIESFALTRILLNCIRECDQCDGQTKQWRGCLARKKGSFEDLLKPIFFFFFFSVFTLCALLFFWCVILIYFPLVSCLHWSFLSIRCPIS